MKDPVCDGGVDGNQSPTQAKRGAVATDAIVLHIHI